VGSFRRGVRAFTILRTRGRGGMRDRELVSWAAQSVVKNKSPTGLRPATSQNEDKKEESLLPHKGEPRRPGDQGAEGGTRLLSLSQ